VSNRDLSVARSYHARTSHSHFSVHTSGHYLNFEIQPLPFKVYEDLPGIPLPREWTPLEVSALDALMGVPGGGERIPSLSDLARLLHHSAGITKKLVYPGGRAQYFRAAANTGALYEIDLYVACGDLEGLPAGLYHFSPHDYSLRRLREGDWRGTVVRATADEGISHAPVILLCSGTYWRNSWKYQARAYRHFGWDNGTMLANTLAMCAALDWPARLVMGFQDDLPNRLLDLNVEKEVVFSLVSVGRQDAAVLPRDDDPPPLNHRVRPLSSEEVDYPLMWEMHAASSLESSEAVRAWRDGASPPPRPAPEGQRVPLGPRAESSARIEDVITRRGSSRRFTQDAISREAASAMLRAATNVAADFGRLNELYVIVNAVEGIPSGKYFCAADGLVSLGEGNFRGDAGHLDLGQPLAADAALNVYYMADLQGALQRYGNRGYRAAQIEAGILGGRLYLAAYALGLGATGLTFYDDDVVDFFSPAAAGLSTIFLMAAGVPARRR